MDLENKNILVTGGSLGIGKETAKALVEKGANVLITGRSQDRLIKSQQYTNAKNIISFDISNIADISVNAKNCIDILDNRVDVLINNAGTGVRRDLDNLNIDDFLAVYNTNVFGLSLLTKEIIPLMKERKGGSIINIGSTASLKGYKGGSIYASSKFAVRALTQCWQAELRPFNIKVTQVNPSEVTTAFANKERIERSEIHNKLTSKEIAHAIVSSLEMDDRGFINELNVWATNPF
ncbi:MAG: short-chain dehydrogenase [Flavobacteriales bacterium]|nr:short-chain dehydrogenase [Flavobacteriales bacterium]|tara:strand:- start:409 stop:1116 length:708 start_codon:yes stop_codon:yes gene_type:complete